MFKRILVCTDGSDISGRAVATAIGLCQALGSALNAISVKEPFPYNAISEMQPAPLQEFYDAQDELATRRLQVVAQRAHAANVPFEAYTVEAEHPWEAIIEHAATIGADLIVMASHGRRGVSALLLGSETQKVLTHSEVPVLVVRG
jgi:nucleotide-binding universal stress UspA family protein